MNNPTTDVAIIGAGPYGLSLAAHLRARDVAFRIFGSPMRFWLDMPSGIAVKSFALATNIYAPRGGYRFTDYCRDRGLSLEEPIDMSLFADYGLWAQQELVPDVEDVLVTHLSGDYGNFHLELSSGDRVSASQVVVAVGLAPFPHLPPELQTGSTRVSHTSQITDYGRFAGTDVTIVGGGQSALEAGGLVKAHGARARIVVRGAGVRFGGRWPDHRPITERLRNPVAPLGPGRLNWVLSKVPSLPARLSDERRVRLTKGHPGPFGTWWVQEQLADTVPILEKTRITSVQERPHDLLLRTQGPSGEEEFATEHVIAGTGFEIDINRISFLDPTLRSSLARIERAPRLSRTFESSVPGLYLIGPAAMFSFGPLLRFVCGAEYAAPLVARTLAANGRRRRPTRRGFRLAAR